jgi:hypothetical protein
MPNLPSWTNSFKNEGIGRGIASAGQSIGNRLRENRQNELDVLREKKKRDEEIADRKRKEQIDIMRYWAPNMTPDQFNKQIQAMAPENRPPDDVIDLIRPIVGANLYAQQLKTDMGKQQEIGLNEVLKSNVPDKEKIKFARAYAVDNQVPTDRIDELLRTYGLLPKEEKGDGSTPLDRTPHGTQIRFLEHTISTLDRMDSDFNMTQLMSDEDRQRLAKLRSAYADISQNPNKAFSPADWNKLLKDVKIIQDSVGKLGKGGNNKPTDFSKLSDEELFKKAMGK